MNDDEGTILVPAGSNTTADIEAQLLAANGSSYVIEDSAFTKLFELYPDDPEAGVPMNTGPGLLASGLIDKTVSTFLPLFLALLTPIRVS